MSGSAHSISALPHGQELLGELLHSLSQPLTSLRCSLELSIDESPNSAQQQTVSAALQQTETVIGMVRLMREYLDAEHDRGAPSRWVALMPVLTSVGEDLSSIAAVRGVRLRIAGTCTAAMRVVEPRLRLALQYLILAVIERQPSGSEITLLLGQGSAGAMLRAQAKRTISDPQPSSAPSLRDPQPKHDSVRATMRRVRLAIAARVFEGAGATLAFDDGTPGFVLRIPNAGGTAS
jgi:hypothetical protein